MKIYTIIYTLGIVLLSHIINGQTIKQVEALEDIEVFENILKENSSYLNKTGFDYSGQIVSLKNDIKTLPKVELEYLRSSMEKIVAQIGDRHSSVRANKNYSKGYPFGFLPFIVAPFEGKVIALQKNDDKKYKVLFSEYPFLISINNIKIDAVLEVARPKDIMAPDKAKFYRQVEELRYLDEIFSRNLGIKLKEKVKFEFTNLDNTKDTTVVLSLSNKKVKWNDIGDKYDKAMRNGNYEKLFQWKQNVGYLIIPDMTNKKKYIKYLKKQMLKYKSSDALIIDIRGNGGGTRDILMALSQYFIHPNDDPLVGNVAYVRTDDGPMGNNYSMKTRYLYTYNSRMFTDKDRKAIDEFKKDFEPAWRFNTNRFSEAFYLVLSHKKNNRSYFYNKPIYILMNERCFSAASVFASVLNELENVSLVGQTTDGSSGRSRKIRLDNSGIRLTISTMISFQPNGKTLDGNGTNPDIEIEPNLNYILGNRDNQIEQLMEIIIEKNILCN